MCNCFLQQLHLCVCVCTSVKQKYSESIVDNKYYLSVFSKTCQRSTFPRLLLSAVIFAKLVLEREMGTDAQFINLFIVLVCGVACFRVPDTSAWRYFQVELSGQICVFICLQILA